MILVGARLDRGVPTITREEMEAFAIQHGFTGGYVGTSSKTGEGVPELIERIKAQLAWNEISAVVTTPVYSLVKKIILQKKQDGQGAVISSIDSLLVALNEQVPDLVISRLDIKSALGHLAAHGFISLLPPLSQSESILLRPDVLINLASSLVLEARRNPRGLGVLEERRILTGEYALEGRYGYEELRGLGPKERDILLETATALFLSHNVCFRERLGVETLLVFPALINLKRPLISSTVPIEDSVTYRIRGETENLYAALVVLLRYTNTFTRTNQWQNQAQYELNEGQICGFQQIVTREGDIEFVLYYATSTPTQVRHLFEGLCISILSCTEES